VARPSPPSPSQSTSSQLAMWQLITCACAWHEVKLTHGGGSGELTGDKLARGSSILVLPQVASAAECADLLEHGMSAADKQQASLWSRSVSSLCEFTSNNPRSAGRVRVPIHSLSPSTSALFDNLLARVFSIIDDELPSVSALFARAYSEGTAGLVGTTSESSAVSLSKLHRQDGLQFSTREPAINVYRSQGEFHAHVDRQTLTVLIPLSPLNSYGGGGTGFWPSDSEGRPGQSVTAPAVVMRPPQGSALLYGGRITHAGMPVETGCRVIFLASFSARRLDLELLDAT